VTFGFSDLGFVPLLVLSRVSFFFFFFLIFDG
jgi:hypothetical protein